MVKDTLDIQRILEGGGSAEVDAKDYDTSDLQRMAESAKDGNGTLIIYRSNDLDQLAVKQISEACPDRVFFKK